MIDHISAAFIGRDLARRAGFNGVLGAALGIAGSIALRRLMPGATTSALGGIAKQAGRTLGLSNHTTNTGATS